MLNLCFRIWAVANLMVFLVFGTFLLRHGVGLGLLSLFYSSLFSLPAVAILYALLRFLRFAQGNLWFSWAVLLTGTALASLAASSLFQLTMADAELDFVLPMSLVCGLSSVLFFSFSLNEWFEKFKYERYENS